MFVQSTLAPQKPVVEVTQTLPWVEKYRPQKIDELAHQEEIVNALQTSLSSGSLPHLLFYGPPGTGKTSAILAIAKQMFGPDLYKSRVLELNASDDRGINVVREKIKKFAQVAVTKYQNAQCPNFKIIILDEADSLTSDAQSALRRVIEKYTKVTRFCLICNYISKIIDPLASRCAKFRFKPISEEAHLNRLKYICEQERINCTNDAFSLLIQVSEGDLRKSITALQSTSKLHGDWISDQMVLDVAAVIPADVINQIYQSLQGTFEEVQQLSADLILEGFQPDSIIFQLFDFLLSRQEISDIKKAKIVEVLAEVDYGLVAGGNESLLILKALSSIQEILNN
ncbi:unnamed protein product [Blepharisma stoltei]|uniref:AAA+ ATPase domain-containing protein n=1 Tax=Blepharisma stoltei TaxID=1481888 RepID=A0AAU9K3H8_9CILI|nr:unnamed protein product [Blepharisma stoltei]